MRPIYIDHNATTPVHPEVFEAMRPYFVEKFGNPSSLYTVAHEAKAALESSRETIAGYMGCQPQEIYFTAGGTESDNLAVKGTAFANRGKGKHVITTPIEHHAVEYACRFLEEEGFEIFRLPVDSKGLVDPADLKKAIRADTTLVSIIHANNETGVLQDIKALSAMAKEANVYFHTDAVQSTGKISYKISDLSCDLLSVSAHKLYGPKGVGLIYIKEGTKIRKWNDGGSQERDMRAGTHNVAGAVGLAKALEIAYRDMDKETAKLVSMTRRFYDLVKERIPDVQFNGCLERRVPNTLSFCFKGIEGESLVLGLNGKGVAVSTGSACTSGQTEPSHVLLAMGIPPEVAAGSLRFSFGRSNKKKDVDYVVDVLEAEVSRLRKMSPIYGASET